MKKDEKLIRHLIGLRQEAQHICRDVQTITTAMGEIIRSREGTENEFYRKLQRIGTAHQAVRIIDAYISHVRGGFSKKSSSNKAKDYVHKDRLHHLKSITNPTHDLRRLVRYCEELNLCSTTDCNLAVVMLVRAIINHVPPIFSAKNFSEVTNNISGSSSFKEAMQHLEKCCRKIADMYLHEQIRQKESLPNPNQVNFSRELDLLLQEVVRRLS